MAYGDLDNDGDLDVVTNNIDAPAFVYENKATGNFLKIKIEGSGNNTFGIGAKAIIHHNGKTQMAENTVTRGFLSSVEHDLFFGLGKDTEVEKVEVIWPNGKSNIFENVSANIVLEASFAKAKVIKKVVENKASLLNQLNTSELGINFKHEENKFDEFKDEVLLPHNISQNGPFSAIGDVNGDDLEDIFIGGAVGQAGVLFLQNESGQFVMNSSQPWSEDKAAEDLGCLFIDVDGDNDKDLYIASGGSEVKIGNLLLKDRLYINDGKGNYKRDTNALPDIRQSTQSVKASDIDKDGDLDLFIGTRLIPGKYPYPASSYFLINNNGIFTRGANNIAPSLQNIGMVTDAVFTDIDLDNDEDLMLVGEWMTITVLINNKGIFEDSSEKYGLKDSRGMWWSITANDIDNDGDDDYVIGNLGRNNKFKASKEHPFKVYANDFDNNGTNDVVLAKFYKDDYVPLRGRECTSQQMPFVADKFKDYHSFASSKLLDILPEDKLENAVIYEINNFESIILINDDGKLKRQSLPIQAQVSPIKSSLVDDFNSDGFKDILIVGNHFGVEVETTRYDAGYGSLLLGDGNNNFKPLPPTLSGLHVPLDSRSVQSIQINNDKVLLITNNNDEVAMFKSVSK